MTIKDYLISATPSAQRGLLLPEWVVVLYTFLTLPLIALHWSEYPELSTMLILRGGAMVSIALLWAVHCWHPCRLTIFVRVVWLMVMLSWWYPDTYSMNCILPNLDHLFAQAEQWLFGCQPALLFSQQWTHPVVSELLSLGYVSYYPLITAVLLSFFIHRYECFERAAFVIVCSFFLFYLIFIFLPVTGPQFYYYAVGLDNIAAGQFPELGNYFLTHTDVLSAPGWKEGWAHWLVEIAHEAGERPTAAFPSSHVGITVELLWLAFETRRKWLIVFVAVFLVLMFFSTFYIMAHYVIDALAGLVVGTLFYFLCHRVFDYCS
jgi:membrane-associated phospholipid phosphatase